MVRGFESFYPYRHVRKIAIFGSARTKRNAPEYRAAERFAQYMTRQGFMVLTGAGGGIMEAGNEGATAEFSFGLNVFLPFEQTANPHIEGDEKLLFFKYFFTRKLFFLRESDAIALFPGGFGTQDEAFESLTLTQTGKFGPAPILMIDRPGGDYWHAWDAFVRDHLVAKGSLDPEDTSFYTITDDLEVACHTIRQFYRVYHSSRYVDERLIVRLKNELSDENVARLNDRFSDILVRGKIEKTVALPAELGDETDRLPRLALHFDRCSLGRLYQMLDAINQMGEDTPESEHPEQK